VVSHKDFPTTTFPQKLPYNQNPQYNIPDEKVDELKKQKLAEWMNEHRSETVKATVALYQGAEGQKGFAEFVKKRAKTDEQKAIKTPEEWEQKVGFDFKLMEGDEARPAAEAVTTADPTSGQKHFLEFVKKNAKTDEQRAIKTPEEWAEKVGSKEEHHDA
jgi:hypothetical protein